MQVKSTKPKKAPILVQIGIFSTILFVSSLISALFPKSFPVPTPVVGLVILYLLLTFKIIKLEWVDSFGSFLISIIAFLCALRHLATRQHRGHAKTRSANHRRCHHLNGYHARGHLFRGLHNHHHAPAL